jgi:4-carboxymuconolactone decarboxylase
MPMPPSDDLSPAQREVADEIRQGPRGEITGPFVALLRSPELLRKVAAVGTHLRFTELAISPAVRELTVLAVARFWEQAFEWTHHMPLAIAAGVPEAACADLLAGERPRGLPDELGIAMRIVVELQTRRGLSDDTYRLAVGAFGEAGVVEITTTAGYYTTLAMVMNVAAAPSPSAVEFGASAAWLTYGSDGTP